MLLEVEEQRIKKKNTKKQAIFLLLQINKMVFPENPSLASPELFELEIEIPFD